MITKVPLFLKNVLLVNNFINFGQTKTIDMPHNPPFGDQNIFLRAIFYNRYTTFCITKWGKI